MTTTLGYVVHVSPDVAHPTTITLIGHTDGDLDQERWLIKFCWLNELDEFTLSMMSPDVQAFSEASHLFALLAERRPDTFEEVRNFLDDLNIADITWEVGLNDSTKGVA